MDSTYASNLTTEEVFEILTRKLKRNDFNLVGYELRNLDKNIGLLGDHATLTATVILNGQEIHTDFFAKFFPKHEGPAAFASETGAFRKEIFVYEVLEKLKKNGADFLSDSVTDCYYSKDGHVIILDDLKKENFCALDKTTTLDLDALLVVIKSLAKLHAGSLVYEENQSKILNRPYSLLDDHQNDFEESFYTDNKGFINKNNTIAAIKGILTEIDIFQLPSTLPSGKDFKATVLTVYEKIFELVKPSLKYRNVLSHGDLWSNNFLIKFENDRAIDCKFVDFQCSRYVPPSQDLMSLIYLTTTRDFRAQHMYELLGIYYATLEKLVKLSGFDLKTIIAFQNFMESCEEQKLFAMIQTATYLQLILVDNDVLEEFFSNKVLYEKTFFEDRSLLVLKYLKMNNNYKSRLTESVLDLKSYCEKV